DLYLTRLAAVRIRNRRAGHRDQLRTQDVETEVAQILLAEAVAGQRQLQNWHGRCVVVEDQRRRDAGRELLEQRLRYRGGLRVGGRDIDGRLEEDLDDAKAVDRLRFDMFDIVDRGGQHALEGRSDTPGHLVRRQAGVLPHHRDHRNLDIRE